MKNGSPLPIIGLKIWNNITSKKKGQGLFPGLFFFIRIYSSTAFRTIYQFRTAFFGFQFSFFSAIRATLIKTVFIYGNDEFFPRNSFLFHLHFLHFILHGFVHGHVSSGVIVYILDNFNGVDPGGQLIIFQIKGSLRVCKLHLVCEHTINVHIT